MADAKKAIINRVYIVYFCVFLFGCAIIYRVFQLQFIEGNYWKSKADSLTIENRTILPVRGNIYTADGSPLLTSLPEFELHFDAKTNGITKEIFNEKIDSLALCLSAILKNKSKEEYKRVFKKARADGDRYFLFAREVSYNNLKSIRKAPIFNRGQYKGGLIAIQKNKRKKPFGELARRTLGYNIPGQKPVGLEASFDRELRGITGRRLMQKISGNVWKPVNSEDEIVPQDGKDLITTIDLNAQDVAEESLLNQLIKNKAEGGCAILMEVATGDIKAIANLKRRSNGIYAEDFNYAIGYSSEPGSTFKLASLMAGIEDGLIDINDNVDCNGGTISYTKGKVLKDAHLGLHIVSVKHAFEASSNVGISRIIRDKYIKNPQAFPDRLRAMHFGDALKLQINGERKAAIRNTKDEEWSKISLPYMSIGYESRLTPLDILTFYNAVANNGKMVKPKFVGKVTYRGQTVKEYKTEVMSEKICSDRTLNAAKELLESVVQKGTGKDLKSCVYKVAGKTGTAQVADNSGGYKNNRRYQASFVGYFPADVPQYSCIVVVYNPSANGYYGGEVAMPVFKDIADKVYATSLDMHKPLTRDSAFFSHLPEVKNGTLKNGAICCSKVNIPHKITGSEGEWLSASKGVKMVNIKPVYFKEGLIPSVIGMGLRDAIYLLETKGLQVKTLGRGTVSRQSIDAGEKIQKGQWITIELS